MYESAGPKANGSNPPASAAPALAPLSSADTNNVYDAGVRQAEPFGARSGNNTYDAGVPSGLKRPPSYAEPDVQLAAGLGDAEYALPDDVYGASGSSRKSYIEIQGSGGEDEPDIHDIVFLPAKRTSIAAGDEGAARKTRGKRQLRKRSVATSDHGGGGDGDGAGGGGGTGTGSNGAVYVGGSAPMAGVAYTTSLQREAREYSTTSAHSAEYEAYADDNGGAAEYATVDGAPEYAVVAPASNVEVAQQPPTTQQQVLTRHKIRKNSDC